MFNTKKWTDPDRDGRIEERKGILNEGQMKTKIKNIAFGKAKELGYNPLLLENVVETLRNDSIEWMDTLNQYEKTSISKYTHNGIDDDSRKLFEKLNRFLAGIYDPINNEEEEMFLQTYANIHNALLKNQLNHDIIVYRNDVAPFSLSGVSDKFLSTSVTMNGVFFKQPNVAIIVPMNSTGAYIERLSKIPTQREFLLDSDVVLKNVYSEDEFCIYEVINNDKR